MKKHFGHEYFGALKTNHSGTPKVQVEEIMEGWPSGTYLVLECEDLCMFYVAHRYSYKRKFAPSLERGMLDLLNRENHTLPIGLMSMATSRNAILFILIFLAGTFRNQMSLTLATRLDRMN